MTARFRELLAEGRGVLRGHREISRRFAALQDMLEEVEDDRDQVRARLEDEQLDHAETQAELLNAKLELDRLRGVLARAGRVDQTRAAVAAMQSPGSFAELLERLDEHVLSCVAFTGDPKNALELDDFDPLGTWAARAWDMLRVLDGYAASRRRGEFSKGVHAYLGHTPPGRPGYAPGAHSTQESDSVRTLTQAPEAAGIPGAPGRVPGGAFFMGAHFKIARKGLLSPRMHYHDDAGHTGKIYVGYIADTSRTRIRIKHSRHCGRAAGSEESRRSGGDRLGSGSTSGTRARTSSWNRRASSSAPTLSGVWMKTVGERPSRSQAATASSQCCHPATVRAASSRPM